jgi:D-serine deaminase-like pyridoxal phosphate-dependent protein
VIVNQAYRYALDPNAGQLAALEVSDGARIAPGDLVCLGISHPYTAFDKWQLIPVVEDDYTLSDLIRTYF